MRPSVKAILLPMLTVGGLSACNADPAPAELSASAQSASRTQIASYGDLGVSIAIWECDSPTAERTQLVTCAVDPDYLLAGGGAAVSERSAESVGAAVTASAPFVSGIMRTIDKRTWRATSRDYGGAFPHVLKVYAVGLKLAGVSGEALRAQAAVASAGSSVAIPGGYVLLGGGGATTAFAGPAPFLVTSRPLDSGSGWLATAAAVPSPYNAVGAFAISIPACPAGFPYCLDGSSDRARDGLVSDPYSEVRASPKWFLTSPGVSDSNIDRYLVGLTPQPSGDNAVTVANTVGIPTSDDYFAYATSIRRHHQCETDADCRTVPSNSCACVAVPTTAPSPRQGECVRDPCVGSTAVCQDKLCAVVSGDLF